jgi:hypothetical protein
MLWSYWMKASVMRDYVFGINTAWLSYSVTG